MLYRVCMKAKLYMYESSLAILPFYIITLQPCVLRFIAVSFESEIAKYFIGFKTLRFSIA